MLVMKDIINKDTKNMSLREYNELLDKTLKSITENLQEGELPYEEVSDNYDDTEGLF